MNRRRLYQIAAEWRAERGMKGTLTAVAEAMKRRRGQVAGKPAAWESGAEIQELLNADDALGQVYQALRAPELAAAYRASNGRKFKASEIPAVTQLFTPDWVVRFLVQNTLGRLWMSMHPDSRLRGKMEFYFDGETVAEPARAVAEIRVCDPACGTMNFGLVAIDLLGEMYTEERERGWAKESSGVVDPSKNLVGFDVDPVALEMARVSLAIKLGRAGRARLILGNALANPITGEFDVVVTNPPYLSARNLPRKMVEAMKEKYPSAWRDAYACFLLRSLDLLRPGGRAGMLAMHSFMFTGGFEKLRAELTGRSAIEGIAHFGPGLFEVGNPGTLQTVGLIVRREECEAARKKQIMRAWRLVDRTDKCVRLRGRPTHRMRQKELEKVPRGAWAYWAGGEMLRMFRDHPVLAQVAQPRQGLATTDNASFVRYWWEVEAPGYAGPRPRWVPYAKSGRFRRWYEAPRHRVDWEEDGKRIKESIVRRYPYLNGKWGWVAKNAQFYGRSGVTYSYLTSGSFSARRLEAGSIFDVAGSSLFPDEPLVMLAILNSSAASRLLSIINPTVNFQVGDLGQLPVPRGGEHLRPMVDRAIEIQKILDSFDETTTDFVAPLAWEGGETFWDELGWELSELEDRIDRGVSELYGLKHVPLSRAGVAKLDRVDLARRWISYGLRNVVGGRINFNAESAENRRGRREQLEGQAHVTGSGAERKIEYIENNELKSSLRSLRFSALSALNSSHSKAEEHPIDQRLYNNVRDLLPSEQIEAAVGTIGEFLAGPFQRWHNQLYRNRPIWRITSTSR